MALTPAEKQKRYRERQKVTHDDNNVTIRGEVVTEGCIPVKTLADAACGDKHGLPENYGQANCSCRMCRNFRKSGKDTAMLNHGVPLDSAGLSEGKFLANRYALPGDADYEGSL